MSPIKRAIASSYDGENVFPFALPPKRLRGGGRGDDNYDEDDAAVAFEEDDAFGDDLVAVEDDDDEPDIPPEVLEEASRAVSLSERQRWERPAPEQSLETAAVDLDFQWLDMDVVSGAALSENPNKAKKHVVGQTKGKVPILRTFGVNQHGNSVCAFIHGFTPYGYFAVPPSYTVDDAQMGTIRCELSERLKSMVRSSDQESADVIGVSHVKGHKSIFGYDTPYASFLKIYVRLPNHIPALKRIMEDGVALSGIETTHSNGGMLPQFAPFECNVPFVLRFMVDRDIAGAGWLTLPTDTYQVRPSNRKETHCQVRSTMLSCVCSGRSAGVAYFILFAFVLLVPTNRLKWTCRMTTSLRANLKENGTRLPPFAL